MLRRIKQAVKSILLGRPSRANYKFLLRDWHPVFELKYAAQILETKRFSRALQPLILDRPEGQRFLVLAPHPDDDIFGAGGVLLRVAAAGATIEIVYFTMPGQTAEQTVALEREARAICAKLGAQPIFLNLPMGAIPVSAETSDRLREIVRTFKPDVLFTTFLLDDHDDHRRINHLLMNALREDPAGIEVWAYQIYSTILPNVVVDISDRMADKRSLMAMWQSVQGNRNWPHYVAGMNAANSRYVADSKETYAEAYFVLPMREYFDLCAMYFANTPDRLYYSKSYTLLRE